MRLNRIIRMCVLVLTSTIVIPTATYAEETEASLIRSMEARLPSLMELKLAGKVGETNLALVEARTELARNERKVLSAENRDRNMHYALIASRINVSVKAVQLKRAQQIRENSPKGIWIQSKSGEWIQQ